MKKRYIALLILICIITTGCNKTLSDELKNKTYKFERNDKNLIISIDEFKFEENGKGIETVSIDTTPHDNIFKNEAKKEFKFKYEIDNNTNEVRIIYSNTEILLKYDKKTKCLINENKDKYCVQKGE